MTGMAAIAITRLQCIFLGRYSHVSKTKITNLDLCVNIKKLEKTKSDRAKSALVQVVDAVKNNMDTKPTLPENVH